MPCLKLRLDWLSVHPAERHVKHLRFPPGPEQGELHCTGSRQQGLATRGAGFSGATNTVVHAACKLS